MGVTLKETKLEGRYLTHSIVTWVRVSPEIAFAYVADIPRHSEWAVNEVHITPLSPEPVRLGSRYSAVGHQGRRDWPSQLEVTAYEPPHRFAFTAAGGPITAADDLHRHEILFTPEDSGTRLEYIRTDPLPANWPAWVGRAMLPLIWRYARGVRLRTVERLQARLNALGETSK